MAQHNSSCSGDVRGRQAGTSDIGESCVAASVCSENPSSRSPKVNTTAIVAIRVTRVRLI